MTTDDTDNTENRKEIIGTLIFANRTPIRKVIRLPTGFSKLNADKAKAGAALTLCPRTPYFLDHLILLCFLRFLLLSVFLFPLNR